MVKQKATHPRDTRVRRIVGAAALAREAGVSRWMIYSVARGTATSAPVAAFLRARGIWVDPKRNPFPEEDAP